MKLCRVVTAAATAALVLSCASPAPALVNTGELHILVILATWGPQPFARADIQQIVFHDADAFVRENSYGTAWLTGEVTPWVNAFPSPPGCGTPTQQQSLATAAQAAAKQAGFDPSTYSRFIYVFPAESSCGYAGYGSLREVYLNGVVDPMIVSHELGHTFGLSHAHTIDCSGTCSFVEYGDPYDTMGHGTGDYNAYEKHLAGWLTNVTDAHNGTFEIDALEPKSSSPQAFVIQTAHNEYWLDHREPLLGDAWLAGQPIVGGVEVHAGPPSSDPTAPSDWNTDNTLVPNPAGTGLPVILPGQTFSERGAFQLTVIDHVGTHVDVKFAWTDTTRPTAPALDSPAKSSHALTLDVEWEPATDTGSGIDHYVVTLDGKQRATVRADFTLPLRATVGKLAPGRHTLSVFAVDRAGNRGRATTRVLSVR